MAEKRMISRRAAKSKKLSRVSYQAEALYYRFIPYLDDAGRMTADPEDFRAEVIPLGKRGTPVPLDEIEACLQELYEVGLIGLCQCSKTRCLEQTGFGNVQVLKSDRARQFYCTEPVGFVWFHLEPDGALKRREGEEKLREGKLREGKGKRARAREETTPPPIPREIKKLIDLAAEIRGWAFSKHEDATFFGRLLETYPYPLIVKTIEDLRVYQERPQKAYKNLHSALRNWCKRGSDWRQDDAPASRPYTPPPCREKAPVTPVAVEKISALREQIERVSRASSIPPEVGEGARREELEATRPSATMGGGA